MLPPESLPWALQHSIFILNNCLVHSSGKTSHFENYRYNYRSKHRWLWRRSFLETSGTSLHKNYASGINIRNFVGIWLGHDLITNEHILALHLQYSQHPSTTTGAAVVPTSAGRSLVYLVKNNMTTSSGRASTGHSTVMTLDFNTREHFNNLQKQNIASRYLQLHQPQDEEDIEQPQGVQPPVLRHHSQAVALTNRTTALKSSQPPPGLPQPLQTLLPRQSMVKQQAAPLPAPLLQGPPPKVQAVPVPPAPQAVNRPAGKCYNHPRGPPPKAANIIDISHEDEHQELLGPNLVDISVDSGILQVATNIDKKEQQLQEDLVKQTIDQEFYEDDLSNFSEDDIKAAIASELHSLGKKNIYGEVDVESLTPEQQR